MQPQSLTVKEQSQSLRQDGAMQQSAIQIIYRQKGYNVLQCLEAKKELKAYKAVHMMEGKHTTVHL